MMRAARENNSLSIQADVYAVDIDTASQARKLLRFPSVTTINIQASALNEMDTSLFAMCHNLKNLNIEGYTGGQLDLRFLEDISSLDLLAVKSRDVANTSCSLTTNEWLLPEHLRLSTLRLTGILPSAGFIDCISTWELGKLHLHRLNYTGDSYRHLSQLRASELALSDCMIPYLPDIRNVQSLDIGSMMGFGSTDLIDLNNLNPETTRNIAIDLERIAHLIQPSTPMLSLEKLELLHLTDRHQVLLNKISRNLRYLYIFKSSLRQKHLKDIGRIPSLESLVLSEVEVDTDLSALSNHQNLRELNLQVNINLQGEHGGTRKESEIKVNEIMKPRRTMIVPALPELRDLTIIGRDAMIGVERIDLSPLTVSKKLQKLTIFDTPITEIDFSPLGSCMQLHQLSLHLNFSIQEYDITPLLHLKSLKFLSTDTFPSPMLFADSRAKSHIESPAMVERDKKGSIEWR